MMKMFIAAAVLISSSALAAEAPVKQAAFPPPSAMTVRECLFTLQGLMGLDVHQVILNAGKPNESAVSMPYNFNNAELRIAIQTDIAALNEVQRVDQKVQQDTYKEVAGSGGTIDPTMLVNGKEVPNPKIVEYNRKVSEAQELPCRVVLTHIHVRDLKLDVNEVPGSVLGALDRILDK